VVLASRRRDTLEAAAAELSRVGPGKAYAVACDLRQASSIRDAVAVALGKLTTIDFLVNNSGLGVQSKIVDCSEDEWDLVLDTNLKGAFLMTQAVLPTMIRARSGFILNIASQAAKHGYANAGPYCASKFGLVGFAEALQQEVREYGIHVHSLCPALIQVPRPEQPGEVRDGVLQVDDLAATALFLFQQPRRVKFENIGLYHL
jgi:NADP-dependent 3-hydroxy acid dehydrogenase YdfG